MVLNGIARCRRHKTQSKVNEDSGPDLRRFKVNFRKRQIQ